MAVFEVWTEAVGQVDYRNQVRKRVGYFIQINVSWLPMLGVFLPLKPSIVFLVNYKAFWVTHCVLVKIPAFVILDFGVKAVSMCTLFTISIVAISVFVAVIVPSGIVGHDKLLQHVLGEVHESFYFLVTGRLYVLYDLASCQGHFHFTGLVGSIFLFMLVDLVCIAKTHRLGFGLVILVVLAILCDDERVEVGKHLVSRGFAFECTNCDIVFACSKESGFCKSEMNEWLCGNGFLLELFLNLIGACKFGCWIFIEIPRCM